MYQSSSSWECSSALSPVLTAADIGAPVTGDSFAAFIAFVIAVRICNCMVSWGRLTPAHRVRLWPAMTSRRAGVCASIMCKSV